MFDDARLRRSIVGATLFLLVAAAQVAAATAVSNLGATTAGQESVIYDGRFPPVLSFRGVYGAFVAGGAKSLIDVNLSFGSGSAASATTVALYSDSSGVPGTYLLSFNGEFNPTSAGTYTYTAPSPFQLTSGAKYWIGMSAGGGEAALHTYNWNYTTSASSNGDAGWSMAPLATRSCVVNLPSPASCTTSVSSTEYAKFSVDVGLDGDFNGDKRVDAADYVTWRKGNMSQDNYNTWRQHFGESTATGSAQDFAALSSVPEPGTLLLLIYSTVLCFAWRFQRRIGRE